MKYVQNWCLLLTWFHFCASRCYLIHVIDVCGPNSIADHMKLSASSFHFLTFATIPARATKTNMKGKRCHDADWGVWKPWPKRSTQHKGVWQMPLLEVRMALGVRACKYSYIEHLGRAVSSFVMDSFHDLSSSWHSFIHVSFIVSVSFIVFACFIHYSCMFHSLFLHVSFVPALFIHFSFTHSLWFISHRKPWT